MLFSRDRIEITLREQFPRIKTVNVGAVGLNDVGIKVVEREMVGVTCVQDEATTSETCYFIDEDGFIFAQAPTFSGDSFFRYYDASKKLSRTYLARKESIV